MLHTFFKRAMPAAAMAIGLTLSGCGDMDIKIGDTDGVPLAELDMSGAVPTDVVLAGPDKIIITDGDVLDIQVEGDADSTAALRFALDDGTLAISREKDGWKDGSSATVRITMPSPSSLVLAGSGSLEAASMAKESSVTIAGSGKANVAAIDADKLEVTVAGSGTFSGAGSAAMLETTIAGSGSAKMAGLKAGNAEVTIAGSGDADFASDGSVEANIVGSGDVTVTGSATCTVNAVGSGKITCQTVTEAES